jgi:RND family efflux transporter MFP subunit
VGLGLTGLLAIRVGTAWQAKHVSPETDQAPVAVSVAKATRRTVDERVVLTGVIRPRNEVDLFGKMMGRIERVEVDVGARVKAGELLAVIEHREVGWQRQQAVAAAAAAEAQLESARIGLRASKTQYERLATLFKQGAIAQAEFDQAETALRAAESGVKGAQAQVAMSQAAAGLAGEAVRNCRIESPIAGTVTKRNVNVGTHASPGAPLFQVQDLDELELQGSVSAEQFAKLRLGQQVVITVDDLRGQEFEGTITTLSPSLDPGTRRAAIEVSVANPEGKLMPNMFAHAAIAVGQRANTLTIPEVAIVTLPTGKVVYVIENGRAKLAHPLFGAADGPMLVVEEGLDDGVEVAVSGQAGLADGTPVRVETESASAAPSGNAP